MASDEELLLSAQKGDTASLGILLERYHPRLYALALRLLGYGPDAQDAVQETFLVALSKLHHVRDPAAVSAWLCTVLRNNCRMFLRRSRPCLSSEEVAERLCGGAIEESVEQHLERLALRDWVWTALAILPETLRVTAMLRYFSRYGAYDEIAKILSIPVGTVRSRLSQVKTKLAGALLKTAEVADNTVRKLAESRAHYYRQAWEELSRGQRDKFLAHYTEDLMLVLSDGVMARGRLHWAQEVDDYLKSGATFHPESVMASGDITVIDGRLENPEQPFHCPPGVAFVNFHHDDKTHRLYRYFAPHL